MEGNYHDESSSSHTRTPTRQCCANVTPRERSLVCSLHSCVLSLVWGLTHFSHLRQTPLWDLFEAVWRHSQGAGSSPAASAWPARAAGNGGTARAPRGELGAADGPTGRFRADLGPFCLVLGQNRARQLKISPPRMILFEFSGHDRRPGP